MSVFSRVRLAWRVSLAGSALLFFTLQPGGKAGADVFDWDDWTGDQQFSTVNNWLPTAGAPPGAGDTAIFDGQLTNLGVGDNTVLVADGTAINDMQVYNSGGFPDTVVDLTIGDGTRSSRFDLDDLSGNSLVVGTAFGDTATLNLRGGWLDTWDALIGGRGVVNVINADSLWDTRNVTISGDTTTNTAGVGVGLRAEIATHGDLQVGTNTGSGRVVVESTGLGVAPSLWSVSGTVSIGPPTAFNFNAGSITLQSGGQMEVGEDVNVHGGEVHSRLTVQSGAQLIVAGTISLQENGVLELSDSDSTITTNDMDIDGGTLDWTGGTLHITNAELKIENTNDADLDTASLIIDSGMTLKVSSPASPNVAFRIGSTGTGTLTIQNGGVVESHHGYIGMFTGGDGTVNVNGASSRWTLNQDLGVGFQNSGIGRLNIIGGEVSANSIWLGAFDTADGTVTVDGGTLRSSAVMAVGGFIGDNNSNVTAGGAGQLNVQNGGVVDVESTLIVFGGDQVALSDGGSTVSADTIRLEPLASFVDSNGTLVRANTLQGFGPNRSFLGNLQIGHSAGSGSGFHAVDASETLSVGANLVVGTDAPATLLIHDGTVHSNAGIIGGAAGADGSHVSLDTGLSFWFSDEIHVGGDGAQPQAPAVLSISNDAQTIVADELKIWGPGAVILDGGIISTDSVVVEGELIGHGAVLLGGGPTTVANHGIVAPGLSPGVLLINGMASTIDAYVQDAEGRLVIEIGGPTPGLYDRLDVVGGSAAVDGYLDVLLIDPLGGSNVFVPHAGDQFEILTADDGLGGTEFLTQPMDLPPLSGALEWDIVYGSDSVRLDVLTPFSADFDGDGDVDNDDLAKWQGDYGGPGSDADGDGDSDGADFFAWQKQYGSGVSPLEVLRAIPEPATLVLALATTLGMSLFINPRRARR